MLNKISETLEENLRTVRAQPAHTTTLDAVKIEIEGQLIPIRALATIQAVDPTHLVVSLFETQYLQTVEKALREANLGFEVRVTGKEIWLAAPLLTDETRTALKKRAKEKFEEALIQLRNARREEIDSVNASEMSDDEKQRAKKEIEKKIKDSEQSFTALLERKVSELSL